MEEQQAAKFEAVDERVVGKGVTWTVESGSGDQEKQADERMNVAGVGSSGSVMQVGGAGLVPPPQSDGGEDQGRLTTLSRRLMILTADELVDAQRDAKACVSKASCKKHEAAFNSWLDFLLMRDYKGDPLLTDGQMDSQEKSALLFRFKKYLHDEKGNNAAQVARVVSGLNGHWISELAEDSFFGNGPAHAKLRSTKLIKASKEELRESNEKRRGSETYPLVLDMIKVLRENYWVPWIAESHKAANLDMLGAYLGVAIGAGTSGRPGNVSAGGNAQSTVELCDLEFQVERPDKGGGHEKIKGRRIVEFLTGEGGVRVMCGKKEVVGSVSLERIDQERLKWVKSLSMDYLITKMGAPITGLHIARRSNMEGELLEDVCIWVCVAGVQDDDGLLTRYGLTLANLYSRKVISTSMVSNAVKAAAVFSGLPPAHFSARSCRSGGNSTLHGAGISEGERDKVAGWAGSRNSGKSNVGNRHYNFSAPSDCGGRGPMRGALAVDGQSTFTLQSVKNLHSLSELDPVRDVSGDFDCQRKSGRVRKSTKKTDE